MVDLPTFAQSGADDHPVSLPVSLYLLGRHDRHVHGFPNAV
jgi:hypothetical protein